MKIPKSKFNVGDAVWVRCEEAGCPPHFEAVVSNVHWDVRKQAHSYAVTEDGKYVSDGYSDGWLTLKS